MISLNSFMLRLFVLLAISINVCVSASRHGELRKSHYMHPTRDHEIFPHGHRHIFNPSGNDGRGEPNKSMETVDSNDPRNNEGPTVSENEEKEPGTSEPKNNNHNNNHYHRTKPIKRSSHSINHQRSITHKEAFSHRKTSPRKQHMAVTKGKDHTHNKNPRKHQSIHRKQMRHGSKSLQPLKEGRIHGRVSRNKNHLSHHVENLDPLHVVDKYYKGRKGSKHREPLKHKRQLAAPQRSGTNKHTHHNHNSHTPPRKLYEESPRKYNRGHSSHGGRKRQAASKGPNYSENMNEDPKNNEDLSSEVPGKDDKENGKNQPQKRKSSKVEEELGGEPGYAASEGNEGNNITPSEDQGATLTKLNKNSYPRYHKKPPQQEVQEDVLDKGFKGHKDPSQSNEPSSHHHSHENYRRQGSKHRGSFKHRSYLAAPQKSRKNHKDHSHKSLIRPLREYEEPPSKDDNEEYSNNSGSNAEDATDDSNMSQEMKNDEYSIAVEPTVDDNKNGMIQPNFKGDVESDEGNPGSEGQEDVMVSPSDDQGTTIKQVDNDSLPRYQNELTQQEESGDVIGYDYKAEGKAEDLPNVRITNEVYDHVKDTELGKGYEELYGSLMTAEGNLIEPAYLTPSYGEDYAVNEGDGRTEEKPMKYIVLKAPIIIKIMKLVLGKV